jgi:hypothetical protein
VPAPAGDRMVEVLSDSGPMRAEGLEPPRAKPTSS